MSGFPPGSFEFADRLMDAKVEQARREVQARRLQRQAGAVEAPSQSFYSAALARLGQRLSAWGAHLQERYTTDSSTPTPSRAR